MSERRFVYSFIDDKDITGYINLINSHFSSSPDHTDLTAKPGLRQQQDEFYSRTMPCNFLDRTHDKLFDNL